MVFMSQAKGNLSDKRNTIDDNFNITYLEEDVKEAVRLLKERLCDKQRPLTNSKQMELRAFNIIKFEINKIFGDKLI